jgi:general secretion pathway protein I
MKTRQKAAGKRLKVKSQGLANSSSLKPEAFSQRGFTLLEVMIALAVIAIALVTLLGLGNRSIDVNGRLQRITQATLLAQQRMTEVEVQAAQAGFEFQVEEGAFEAPFDTYRWATAYEDTPLPYLRIVRVTVAWGEARQNEEVELASFVYRRI